MRGRRVALTGSFVLFAVALVTPAVRAFSPPAMAPAG